MRSLPGVLALSCAIITSAGSSSAPYLLPFLPAPSSNGFRNESLWSWGGGVLLVDGVYHLFASAFDGGCGLGAWGDASIAIHATAASAVGPFSLAGRALPFYHHNVQPVRALDRHICSQADQTVYFQCGFSSDECTRCHCRLVDPGGGAGWQGKGARPPHHRALSHCPVPLVTTSP